ncbi:hypothetical protein [Ornithinibacter aureus]|uniref:hypothetical protein n=1 Tax=Ornithinibacter aureus TaxID=622664 RepID=UPI001BA7C2FC|nr:hypothetical protein [Ornithinibacter aureus]
MLRGEEEVAEQHAANLHPRIGLRLAVVRDPSRQLAETRYSVSLSMNLPGLLDGEAGEPAEESTADESVGGPVRLEEKGFAGGQGAEA